MWYCYYGNELVRLGTFYDFQAFLDLPHVWYLSEIDDSALKVLAKTIVTLSPRETQFLKFHVHLKEVTRNGYLCMPTWTFEEILECRKEIFSHLPEELVSELFDKVGGVPRSVLLTASPENVERALIHVRHPVTIKQHAVNGLQDMF